MPVDSASYQGRNKRSKAVKLNTRKRVKNEFQKDLSSMGQVWKMLKEGAVTWLGEIGRQY